MTLVLIGTDLRMEGEKKQKDMAGLKVHALIGPLFPCSTTIDTWSLLAKPKNQSSNATSPNCPQAKQLWGFPCFFLLWFIKLWKSSCWFLATQCGKNMRVCQIRSFPQGWGQKVKKRLRNQQLEISSSQCPMHNVHEGKHNLGFAYGDWKK